ncbi:MAG TPA: glycosyltransferase, partial [Defluviitoga tunisiensis]|nr:glycosyltransferase [Defluviitoga tunisiensis]
ELSEKNEQIAKLKQALVERDKQIADVNQELSEKNEQIAKLKQALVERDKQIANLNQAAAERDNRIEELNQAVAERAGQITNLTRLLSDREEQMSRLNQLIFERDRQIAAILNSRSWQFSKPLRWFGRFIRLQKFRYLLIISKFKGSKFGKLLSNLKNYSLKVEGYVKAYGFLALLLKVRERIRLKSSYTNKNSMIEIPKIKLMNIKDDDLVLYPNSTVSVIIPTKNAGNEFHYLLTMLQNQEGIQDIEIIVVDSGSTDETVEVAKKAGAKIIEIPPESFSHSYSRNLGAEHARGDYLLFMTQDALPSGNRWIYQLISFVKTNDVAAVSCVEFPREDCDLIYRVLLWNHARFLEVDKGDRILAKPQKENSVSLRKNGQLSDVACLIKKNVFQKFKYRYDYGEDLDLGIRLIRDNYKIGLLSSTVVIHSHNREPFYYLKRWYVETQALNKILPDTAILKINCEELINNVLFAFYKLNYLTEMLSTLRVPTTVRLLEQTVCEVLDSPNIDVKYIDIHSIEKNKYIDSNFKLFLQQIYSTYPNPETGNNGLIITKTKAFLELVLTFMNNIYTHVDEVILGEFISCMYKAYGLILGECLAYCYLNTTEATDNLLKNINDDLRKGV